MAWVTPRVRTLGADVATFEIDVPQDLTRRLRAAALAKFPQFSELDDADLFKTLCLARMRLVLSEYEVGVANSAAQQANAAAVAAASQSATSAGARIS
jgi:Xaa-Pro aminopeptidase